MRGIKVELTGVKELQEKFKNLTAKAIDIIQDEFNRFGLLTVADAKRACPVNEGFLRNSITYEVKGLQVEIIVAADYAAYVEFGTGKFAASYVASLPADWQAFAAKFKGKGGGTFEEFVERLTRWVMKKGIGAVQTRRRDRVGKQSAKTTAEADAYAIALYILRNGSRAHPFLYPAVDQNKKVLIDRLKKQL